MDSERRLLIVGASARAAACSAARAGFAPVAVDLFGDRDLAQVAAVRVVRRWPRDIVAACRQAPDAPWMYTGALENHPRIVTSIGATRPLWGNPAAVVRRVRDPWQVCTALREAGLPAVEVRDRDDPPPGDGSWLLKPRRSAGGRGIHRWAGEAAVSRREPCYFQRYVAGTPISAVFVATPPGAALLGITRQLVGLEPLSAAPFAYCGSIGPLSLASRVASQIESTGIVLAGRFGLQGLFGVDFVLDGGAAFAVEVNPRYTASVEVLEHALGIAAIGRHAEAFDERADAGRRTSFSAESRIVAKAILYAPQDVVVSELDALAPPDPIHTLPAFADLPRTGAFIPTGRPICTVLASGGNAGECLRALNERLADLRGALGLPPSGDLDGLMPTR